MNYVVLLKREFWEHRGSFFTTQIVLGSSILILLIMGLILIFSGVLDVNSSDLAINTGVESLQKLTPDELSAGWKKAFTGLTVLFNVVLFIVVTFYLLGALADDRKDRSILFWRSMPVTDTATVLSKYASATLLAPALMIAALALTQFGLMLIATVMVWMGEGSSWQLVWSPAHPWTVWINLIGAYLVQAVWMAPLFGWFLLASAYSKRRPFLTAVVPIVVFSLLENWISLLKSLNLSETFFTPFIFNRLSEGPIPMIISNRFFDHIRYSSEMHSNQLGNYLRLFQTTEMWVGLLIGIGLIAAAIFVRHNRDDA